MKLSTAIRKGCKSTKQGFNALFPSKDTACVLGSVILGIGYTKFEWYSENKIIHDLNAVFPLLMKPENIELVIKNSSTNSYSTYKEYTGTVRGIMIELNDKEKWSRQRIANWVSKIEKKKSK